MKYPKVRLFVLRELMALLRREGGVTAGTLGGSSGGCCDAPVPREQAIISWRFSEGFLFGELVVSLSRDLEALYPRQEAARPFEDLVTGSFAAAIAMHPLGPSRGARLLLEGMEACTPPVHFVLRRLLLQALLEVPAAAPAAPSPSSLAAVTESCGAPNTVTAAVLCRGVERRTNGNEFGTTCAAGAPRALTAEAAVRLGHRFLEALGPLPQGVRLGLWRSFVSALARYVVRVRARAQSTPAVEKDEENEAEASLVVQIVELCAAIRDELLVSLGPAPLGALLEVLLLREGCGGPEGGAEEVVSPEEGTGAAVTRSRLEALLTGLLFGAPDQEEQRAPVAACAPVSDTGDRCGPASRPKS